MSGSAGALINQLTNPPMAQPQYWGQQMSNLNALKDYAGDAATQKIMQQPGVVDPTTGQVNQGTFNALVSADPDASWKAAQRMQAQGAAQAQQADAQNQTVAGHLAQLKVMNGEMSDLLQSGQPITAAQVQARLNGLGKEGILTPAVMNGIAADLNSQPPGADLTGWLRNHMATNLSASEQLQNVSSQPYHYDAGGYIGVGEGNPNRPGYMGPGSVVGKTLTPEGATDIATIQFPDGHTQQVPRGQVPTILSGTSGAKEIPTYEGTIQAHEGSGPDQRLPSTVAGFRPDTWTSFAAANPTLFAGMSPQQVLDARNNPALVRQGITWLAQQNAGALSKSGVKPTGQALGIAHYVGATPTASIMNAPDNAPVANFVGAAALAANPELRTMTVGQMKQRYAGVPDPSFLGGGGGATTTTAAATPPPPAPAPAQVGDLGLVRNPDGSVGTPGGGFGRGVQTAGPGAPTTTAPAPPAPVVAPAAPPAVAPQPPAPQPGVSPAPGLVPAKVAAAEASTKRGLDLVDQYTKSTNIKPILAGMEQELNQSGGTGIGTDTLTNLRQAAVRLGIVPEDSKTASQQSALEQFKKLSSQLQMQQLNSVGGIPTDDRQSLIQASNPSAVNSTAGNRSILHVLQGNQQAIDTMAQAWMSSPEHAADPGSFDAWRTKFVAKDPQSGGQFDPRAFWLNNMPADEQHAYLSNIAKTPKAMAEFRKNWNFAIKQGWVSPLSPAEGG